MYIYIFFFFLGTFKHGWKIGTRAWRKWDKSGLGRYFCPAPQSSKFEENFEDSHYVILCTWAQDQLSFVLGMAFTCKPKFELVLTSIIMLFKIHANGISIITQARDKKIYKWQHWILVPEYSDTLLCPSYVLCTPSHYTWWDYLYVCLNSEGQNKENTLLKIQLWDIHVIKVSPKFKNLQWPLISP